jgi:uncharacterized protein YbjT (DUF2867 family)
VRDTAKAAALAKHGELVKGDLADPSSLDAAFQGVDSLFLLTAFVEAAELHAKHALDAAQTAGVKHVVYLSAIGADASSPLWVARDHSKKEALVQASGMTWAIVQPTFFMSNLANFNAATLKSQGIFYGSSGGRNKYPPLDPVDTAEVLRWSPSCWRTRSSTPGRRSC